MRHVLLLGACAVALLPGSARGQHAEHDSATGRLVAHTLLGWFTPRASLRQTIDRGVLIGGQVAYRVRRVAFVTGLTVTQSDGNRAPVAKDPDRILLLQFDVGVEAGAISSLNPAWRGFVGAGFGGRSYRFEMPPRPTVAAAYVGAGAEWRPGRGGLRAEVRDYFSAGIVDADRGIQHDLQLLVGLGYHFR